jgi:hypothetical protein
MLECLCTIINTSNGDRPISPLVGREILVQNRDKVSKDTEPIPFDSLSEDVKEYFIDNIPGYLQMMEKDSGRFKQWVRLK